VLLLVGARIILCVFFVKKFTLQIKCTATVWCLFHYIQQKQTTVSVVLADDITRKTH